MHRPTSATLNLLVAVLCLVWSSTWWAIRVGLEELPPLTGAALRFLIAGLVMTGVAALFQHREAAAPPPRRLWLAMGLTNFALSYGIIYWTETRVPSGIAAVLWAIYPILMAIAGHRFLNERLRPRQAIGFLVAFLGVVVVFLGDLGGAGEGVEWYALALLLSPLCAAFGTTIVKRAGSGYSSLLLNRNGMLVGGAALLIAALLCERDATMTFGARAWWSLLYLALVGTCLTFGLYFWLLRWAPANKLSLIAYVTPPLALLFGWLMGDGDLDTWTLGGTGIIAVGIALVVRRAGG